MTHPTFLARASLVTLCLSFLLLTQAQTGALVSMNTTTSPLTFNYISGGDSSAKERYPEGEGCAGWVAEANQPDHILTVEETLPFLRVTVNSNSDTTMVVLPVDVQGTIIGTIHCNDDAVERNPEISLEPWEKGIYHIFVGSFEESSFYNYSITFSQQAR